MSAEATRGGGFVLLASYPKSGNTWVRATLTAYLSDAPLDLGQLIGGAILSLRRDFDEFTGLASADLTLDEIDLARPSLHAALSALYPDPWFVKAHDGWYRNAAGAPIFDRTACRGAVYIVRHPAAVLSSFAHHRAEDAARTADFMAQHDALHDWWSDAIDVRLPQRLFSWSEHVSGWLDQTELPVLCIRYEDMIADPAAAIDAILRFAGVAVDAERLQRAVAAAEFGQLAAMEASSGFRERPAGSGRFFRSGRAEAWREHLPPGLGERVAREHHAVMQRLGYTA